jgi:hypothetical protein
MRGRHSPILANERTPHTSLKIPIKVVLRSMALPPVHLKMEALLPGEQLKPPCAHPTHSHPRIQATSPTMHNCWKRKLKCGPVWHVGMCFSNCVSCTLPLSRQIYHGHGWFVFLVNGMLIGKGVVNAACCLHVREAFCKAAILYVLYLCVLQNTANNDCTG